MICRERSVSGCADRLDAGPADEGLEDPLVRMGGFSRASRQILLHRAEPVRDGVAAWMLRMFLALIRLPQNLGARGWIHLRTPLRFRVQSRASLGSFQHGHELGKVRALAQGVEILVVLQVGGV